MLKTMSLAKKITGGFLIILILLIIIAFVGRVGLIKVVTKVDSANDFQLLVNHVVNTRQNEKKFILTNSAEAVDNVKKELAQLKQKTKEISSASSSESAKKQTSEILSNLEKYNKAFLSYVLLANKKDTLMKDMNSKADLALQTTAAIRDEQKAEYENLQDESASKVIELRLRVKYAIDIHKAYLHAKGYRMTLTEMNVNEKGSFYTEWLGKHNDLKLIIDRLKPLVKEAGSKKALTKVSKVQDVCIKKARTFLGNKNDDNRLAMIKAAKALQTVVIIFHQEMQEQLEFYVEDVQIFSGQMMELSSGADQIAKILLKTRILEKEFIRTEDDTIFKRIIENIKSIDKVVETIKENIDDEEKTKPLDGIQVSVKNYLASFKSYAGLMREQQTASTSMELNAENIQKVCLQLKDDQHTLMQSQISQSQSLITFVSLCAVVFGGIIAFFLIRIIIKPLQKVVNA
ncbi:MAG: hypothetical protein KAR45_17800, partial [Desulfobacteraceae bacterium]|nr:hypothetical protein [Desulfobacteraceae bacterium]